MLIFSIAIIHFFVGALQTVTPVLADLMEGKGTENLGYFQTAFGLGMVGLAAVFGAVGFMKGRERGGVYGAIFLIGGVNLVISILELQGVRSATAYLVSFFVYGGLLILAVTCFRTLIQQSVPNIMAGRVFGIAFSAGDASIPLAMLIYGLLLDRFLFCIIRSEKENPSLNEKTVADMAMQGKR